MSAYGDSQEGGLLQEVLPEEPRHGGRDPLPDTEVEVDVELTTGGRRRVRLPASEVRGRTPGEVLGAALNRVERGNSEGGSETRALRQLADLTFARNVRRLMGEPESGVEMFVDNSEYSMPVVRSEVRLQARQRLRFEIGVDETGGRRS